MFGNRIGWGISTFLVLITCGLLYLLDWMGKQPQPPTRIGEYASRWTLNPPPPFLSARQVAAPWLTEDADAIDLYQQIIADVKTNKAYDDFLTKKSKVPMTSEENAKIALRERLTWPETQRIQKGLDLLVKASTKKRPGVFRNPEILLSYDREYPDLKALMKMGDQVGWTMACVYEAVGQKDKRMELLKAIFSLGLKLSEEGVVLDEWRAGRKCQGVARYLGRELQDPVQARTAAGFDRQWDSAFANDWYVPVERALLTMNPHAGDMINLALYCKDPTWRDEAILALGRCKYSRATLGDRYSTMRVLEKLSRSSDPIVRQAAKVALELTPEEFRKMN